MSFAIGRRQVGPGQKAFIVAELSANHGQDFEIACRLVRAAAEAGADAVKLQTYTPDCLTIDCTQEHFRIAGGTPWDGATLYELYGRASTPWQWHAPLQALAGELDLEFFSTPFDASAVALLEELDVPAHKIASFELVDTALLECVARTGKPVILSTGMATRDEIGQAVGTLRRAGSGPLALLKCTSAYPAPADGMHLRTIGDLAARFDCVAGLSDHTLGIAVPVAAVAVGACVVEKHLTLSRRVPGPDSSFSLEPAEFAAMVQAIRMAEAALGEVHYGSNASEQQMRSLRRSLFVVRDVPRGEPLTADNVRSIRPGHGLPPCHLSQILGRPAAVDLSRGTPLEWRHIG
jgi:pseudaminic acid synthase